MAGAEASAGAASKGAAPAGPPAAVATAATPARVAWRAVRRSRIALVSLFVLVFVICTKELSTAVFLSGPASRVVSVLTLDLSEQGNYETLAAMGVVLVAIVTLVVAIGMRVAGRDFMLRRS